MGETTHGANGIRGERPWFQITMYIGSSCDHWLYLFLSVSLQICIVAIIADINRKQLVWTIYQPYRSPSL